MLVARVDELVDKIRALQQAHGRWGLQHELAQPQPLSFGFEQRLLLMARRACTSSVTLTEL
jgi:hypothetical protein